MSSPPTGKNITNDLYHAAIVGGLAIGYAKLEQMVFKGSLPRLNLTPRDAGMAVLDLSAAMATKDMLIKQGLIPSDICQVVAMATIAMLLGGATVNALAFSGSNYLFSMLQSSGIDEKGRRHGKAVEQLQATQEEWSKQRTERLDWINEELRHKGHAVQTFGDVDTAIHEYAQATGHKLDSLGSEPQLSDFYTPIGGQKNREITFVVVGMAATGLVAYKLA